GSAAAVGGSAEHDLSGVAEVECGRAVSAEDLDAEAVRMAGGDARDLEGAGAGGEFDAEAGVVVVADGFELVADLGVVVSDDVAERQRAGSDRGVEASARDLLDGTGEEFDGVGQVAADIGQRSAAELALVAPAHRCGGGAGVVRPVPGVDVLDFTERSVVDEVLDRGQARGSPE